MRRFSSLPWFLLIMGSTALAAAGPGILPRTRVAPQEPEIKRQPTPTPERRAASKPPAAKPFLTQKTPAKPAAPKPTVAKTEPRPAASAVSAPVRSAKAPPATASESRGLARSPAAPEPATTRRALREWDLWLAAVQTQVAGYRSHLARGADDLTRINDDPSLSALVSERNRTEAAIPAAVAARVHRHGNPPRDLTGRGDRPAPLQVEQLMKQGESIAFRTSTSTSDTQGLIARIRRTPGVAAGGHLGLEAMAPDLITAQLRTLPGALGDGSRRQPYAVQDVAALRVRLEDSRADLPVQFSVVRQEWVASSTRAGELHRKYMDLRTALVAPDE